MNKLISCFLAILCLFVLSAMPVFAQTELDSPYNVVNGRHQDFAEIEKLFSGPIPSVKDESFVPDYRQAVVEHAERFEVFLEKYPDSPLKPEILLRTAVMFLNVEAPGVYKLRRELCFCQAAAMLPLDFNEFEICQRRYALGIANMGGAKDTLYEYIAKQMLYQLAEQYPRAKRYIMIGPQAFSFDEEEVGAFALYMLANNGMLPEDRRNTYELILREYKIRPAFQKDIEQRLENKDGPFL